MLNNKEFSVAVHALYKKQYMEALGRFKDLFMKDSNFSVDILIELARVQIMYPNDLRFSLISAEMSLYVKRPKDAFMELEVIFQKDEYISGVFPILGELYNYPLEHVYGLGMRDHIEKIFERAVEKGHWDETVVDLLPKIYLAKKDRVKAIGFYESLIRNGEDKEEYFETLTDLYLENRSFDKAITSYQSWLRYKEDVSLDQLDKAEYILKFTPKDMDFRRFVVELCMRLEEPDRALKHIHDGSIHNIDFKRESEDIVRDILKKFPGRKDLSEYLVIFLLEKSAVEEALEVLEDVYQDEPLSNAIIQKLFDVLEKDAMNSAILKVILRSPVSSNFQRYFYYLEAFSNSVVQDLVNIEDILEIEFSILNLIKLDPSREKKFRSLIDKLYSKLEMGEALATFERQYRSDNLDQKKVFAYSHLLMKKGDYVNSYNVLNSFSEAFPDNVPCFQRKMDVFHRMMRRRVGLFEEKGDSIGAGLSCMSLGLYREAISFFEKTPASDSKYFLVKLLIARCYIGCGAFLSAISYLHNVQLKEDLLCIQAFLLATSYYHLGDYKKSTEQLEIIIRVNPDYRNIKPMIRHVEFYTRSSVKVVVPFFLSKFSKMVPIVLPYDISNIKDIAILEDYLNHINKGVASFFRGNMTSVESSFKQAYSLNQEVPLACINLASLYIFRKDYDKAERMLSNQILGVLSEYNRYLVFMLRAIVRIALRQWPQVVDNLNESIASRESNPIAYIMLGDILLQNRNILGCRDRWQIVRKNPFYYYFLEESLRSNSQYLSDPLFWLDPHRFDPAVL